MTSRDMNIAMKFTADVNRAKANIEQLNAGLKASSEIAKEANSQTASSYRDVYKAQNEAMNRGAKAVAAQEKQIAMQKAAAKAAEVHKKEVEKLRQGLDKLLSSIDPATKGLSRLDELESKLRKSKQEGVIDNDSFNDYLGKIDNQRAALSTIDSLNSGTKKLSLNSKTARQNVITMVRAFASGNISTAGNNLLHVGNVTGKLPPLFSAAALSAVAFSAAAFGVYKVISTILAEQERFNRALSTTGNYAGTTSAGLESMSKSIGKINHNYRETRSIISQLAASGRLSASSIKRIGTAAAYMSAATGKSSQETVGHFKNIEDSVTSWALESNKQYHFLDLATFNRIATLEAQGKTEEAIALAAESHAERMKKSIEDAKKEANWLQNFWKATKDIFSEVGEGIQAGFKSALNLNDLEEKIAELEKIKNRGFMIIAGGQSINWDESFEKKLQNLYKKKKIKNEEAQLEAHNANLFEKSQAAQKALNAYWQQNSSELEKQNDAVEQLRKQYQALWADAEGQTRLKEKGVSSNDGQTFNGGQYDQDIKSITDKGLKQYNEQLTKSLDLEKALTTLAKVQIEITEGKFKNASEQEKAIAISLAKQVDALKTKQALEKQSTENSKINQNLQTQLNC